MSSGSTRHEVDGADVKLRVVDSAVACSSSDSSFDLRAASRKLRASRLHSSTDVEASGYMVNMDIKGNCHLEKAVSATNIFTFI